MAYTDGAVGSWNRTVGVRIDMDEAVAMLSPDDVPLQQWLSSSPTDSIKVEWMDEELMPQAVTLNAAVTGSGTTAAPWVCGAADTSELRVGDVLQKKDSAYTNTYIVTEVTNATSFKVTDFSNPTTPVAAAPANADTLEIVGQYRDEGSDPVSARSTERVANYNYTQWGQEAVQATRTQRGRAMYAQSDPYEHELMKKFKELAIRYERSLINGIRLQSSDNKKRMMGGLFYFISTNSQSGVKANAASLLNTLVRQSYTLGGNVGTQVLWCSPAVKAAISASIDPTLRRYDRADTTGGYVIERVTTDFGDLVLKVDRHMPKTKALLVDSQYVKRRVFDPYFHEALAKTGDSDKGQIVGEFTVEVKAEKAHGILTLTDAS